MKRENYITVLILCKIFNIILADVQEGFQNFQNIKYGFRLHNKIITSFTYYSISDCAEECHRTLRCKSLNYYKGANYCEINYQNRGTATDRYLNSDGWIYSEKEDWEMDHLDFCSALNCTINERCSEVSMDTLQCTVSDCGVPVILGADMNSVERWDGIGVERRMRLQCLSPYSRKGSGVILCQKDGQWKTDILCGFEFQGHFYRFHSEATTWEGAEARCHSFGGYLVEIDTGNERDWIFTTFIAPNFRQEDCQQFYDCGSWTGGRIRDGELTFVWRRSGNPIGNNLWYDGQPNNNGDDQDCVELTRQSGLLNDRGCLTPNAYICEWDP